MDFFEALWNDLQKVVGKPIMLGSQPITTLNIIVWSLFIGFMIGIGVTLYNKFVLGSIVRRLIERGANTEDSAVLAAEIGCANPFTRFALRKSGSFRKIVRMKGDSEAERSNEPFDTARFYIPDETVHRAEVIYGNTGTSVITVLLSILALLVVALLSFIIIPDLIQMFSNFISNVTPNSNIL